MSANLQQVVQRLNGAVQQQNGDAAAQLLNWAASPAGLHLMLDLCIGSISAPFDEIISLHVRAARASHQGQHTQAMQMQTQAAELLYTAMEQERESNWMLPVINVVLRSLRFFSYSADGVLESSGEKPHFMIDTQDILKRYLQKMVIDRTMPVQRSKKIGCLFIIVHLFKLYFKLNNLKLCTFLIKMVGQLPPLHQYPKAQVVAYRYYLGRLNVFEERYEEAEESLSLALKHCHKASVANRRRILHFLIPVRLLRARFPQPTLLEKHNLKEFGSIIAAIKNGDLEQFNRQLMQNQTFFIQKGIYLILEKLKIFVYRNLFRKVHKFHILNTPDPALRHQLPLDTLLAALRVNGTDMSMDELECILANLIFQQNMKGYIAHKRCVVLSKQDPFPQVS